MATAAKLIKDLSRFASCDIGDALARLRYPRGGFLDGISIRSPNSVSPGSLSTTKIIGPAVTVKMADIRHVKSGMAPKPPSVKTGHFVDHNRPGAIMYIQQPKGMYSACWGGLMSTRAKYLGAEGVVVDGRIRDVEEHKEKAFPVFSKATSILGSGGFTQASEIDVPLQVEDDLWVNPGDILVGDIDGVVVVPVKLIPEVVALCQERYEQDQSTFADLDGGMSMGEAIKKNRPSK